MPTSRCAFRTLKVLSVARPSDCSRSLNAARRAEASRALVRIANSGRASSASVELLSVPLCVSSCVVLCWWGIFNVVPVMVLKLRGRAWPGLPFRRFGVREHLGGATPTPREPLCLNLSHDVRGAFLEEASPITGDHVRHEALNRQLPNVLLCAISSCAHCPAG
jgi:hypothetical protein